MLWHVLSTTDKFLKDHPELQFRFLTTPTPAMRREAARLAKQAKDTAIDAACCECAPWDECGHRDLRTSERWWLRGWKLDHASDQSLMEMFCAATQDVWLAVDRLGVNKGGCRP